MNKLLDEIKKVAASRDVIIGGDFNLTVSNWPGPERPTCKQDLAIQARLADKEGVQDAVVEALFRAYFTEGRDISKRQTLIDVVAEPGLDRAKAEDVLNGGDGLEAMKEAEELSRRFRVEGVPFFIIDGRITRSGAQQPDALLDAFGQAA